ncbi:flavin-binding monooxygenase protein [Rutstroemia sp. NJR-2017a BBW]|nr:flavin-binding monooxygenase protein [Rutstroemia sp. NJR-2017a BBW]
MSDPNPIPTMSYGRNTNTADVLIIGAGLSGMTTAIEMIRKGLGRNFIIVEKGNQVGGTWNDQRYPGCCCDVWSHLYSLSFEPNPNWTREYPGQEEILDYLISIAHKYQLYRHIRFNTAVSEARWDASTNTWKSTLIRLGSKDAEFGSEYTVTSRFLVSAVGQLNVPKYPDILGLEQFHGKKMHTARWDWEYDVSGKRVGIIGNGATAVQIVPEVAKVCKEIVVFQRTPNWIIPRDDKEISGFMQGVYRWVPFVRRRYRAGMMDFRESFYDAVFDKESKFQEDVVAGAKAHMENQLPGDEYKDLREKLLPRYAVGCKRVVISDDYYPTFRKENAKLETSPIREITKKGVKVDGQEHEFDLLVLATGFQTTQFMYPIKIYGKDGKSIEELWKSGAKAFYGMTVPHLPNFGMLYVGPNTNLGHNSIILMIEAQALYITSLISHVLNSSTPISIAPKLSTSEKYNEEIQSRLSNSAFADPNCNSWYKNESGLITNNWAGTVIEYQEKTRVINWDDYEVKDRNGKVVEQTGETKWRRRHEETQISNGMILGSLALGVGAVAMSVFGKSRLGLR